MFVVKRSRHNPILIPDPEHYWEASATFNLSPISYGKKIYGIYRALSAPDPLCDPRQVSVIGIGESKDGINFEKRRQFILPKEKWERYGCEDPRATFFEGNHYIFYTALSGYPFNADNIKVAVAISKDLKKVDSRHLVTPFNAKAMTLFPERINGKITALFSFHTDTPPTQIVLVQADKMEDFWSEAFWKKWQKNIPEHVIDLRRTPYDHFEIGATPIKTKEGWLLAYSYIQNYFPSPDNWPRVFGVEVAVLDLKDPRKIIGKTKKSILAPKEIYELRGYVPNIVFPSGALLKKNILTIYYGAADTTVCSARIALDDLMGSIMPDRKNKWYFKRETSKPIISPIPEHAWEAKATFNPAAILIDKKTHLLYRALSNDNTSTIGYASTVNGINIDERLTEPVYIPREQFEMKKINNANSGCEDPRLTQIGKNIYMLYTAFDSIGPPEVAITSITEDNFKKHNWIWSKPTIITPAGLDDKDTCLFPSKFSKGYFILHRVDNSICGDYLPSINFASEIVKKCILVLSARPNMWDNNKVGITAPPIKTKKGWLLLYHGVSKENGTYRVGAVLLDLKDPTIVLARSTDPIFEPEEKYEKEGIINNVVFPCGITLNKGILFMYYGGGDRVIGVSTMKLKILLDALVKGSKLL